MSASRLGGTGVAWTNGSTTSPNVPVDCTGANFLFCLIAFRNTATTTISSATYAGNAMTRHGTVFQSASPRMDIDLFYIDNPTTGTNNIVATASAAIGGAGNDGVIYPHACAGVDLTTRFGTRQTFEAISPFSALDIALSSAAGELCIDLAFVNGTISTLTADAGQSALGLIAASSVCNVDSSTEAGAGTVNMGWDYTPSASFNAVQYGIPVTAAAGGSTHAGPLVDGALIKNLVNGAIIA
jgi:hypothetical protein